MSNVKIITDSEFIKKFIYDDPELFDRISDDYTKKFIPDRESYEPLNTMWLGYFEDDICKGMMSVDRESSIILNVHINIPKEHRGKGAYKIGNTLLRFVENNCDLRYIKINADIPSIYKDVIKFAEKNGFVKYGLDKESFLKNGKLHDRILMSKKIVRGA